MYLTTQLGALVRKPVDLIYSGDEMLEMTRQAGFRDARYMTKPNWSLGWLCCLAQK